MPGKIKELESELAVAKFEEKEALQKKLDRIYRDDYSKSGQAKGLNETHVCAPIQPNPYIPLVTHSMVLLQRIGVLIHHAAVMLTTLSGVLTSIFGYHANGVSLMHIHGQ